MNASPRGRRLGDCGMGWWMDVLKCPQGNYGCLTDKPTWLYAYGIPLSSLPRLKRGKSGSKVMFTVVTKRDYGKRHGKHALKHKGRSSTPVPFRDVLIDMARRCYT